MDYAVGFARPDRWSWNGTSEQTPWHAVSADRPPRDLDGVVDLAVCGAIVQVWGSQRWERMGTGRTACPECVRLTARTHASAGGSGSRGAPLLRAV
ncbi:hypothetical protein [Trujillonella endophytica]|uniref:Uncharacterized protein n=1 Tax=Trujillonella endophytica TaxID=673521 RepID=A0A1H8W866_9ACTN|nr:hypothetical protein [Trujillella endophytica]SEP23831.1 hypothetical protein SAMN05660991_04181 [Trujillella endophytica]